MSNYHTHSIEDYQFTHGLHRIMSSGKYIALHPHFLGRPLTHEEMDFNLLYAEQTLAGFRIFGSNVDLTLSDDDLGKSLVFHKIASNDDDFARYTAAGYTEGQYIWIPDCCGGTPIDCSTFQVSSITATDTGGYSCGDFVVDSITATDSGGSDDCISFVVDSIVATDSEGGENIVTPTPTAAEVITPTPTATEVITPTPTATATAAATPEPTAEPTPTATPEPLISSNNLDIDIWYDASDTLTIQPSATDGTDITQWNDKSAIAHNASPTGGGQKPTYVENVMAGNGALYYDANGDGLSVNPLTSLQGLQQTTVFMVVNPEIDASSGFEYFLFDGTDYANATNGGFSASMITDSTNENANKVVCSINGATWVSDGFVLPGQANVIGIRFDGSTIADPTSAPQDWLTNTIQSMVGGQLGGQTTHSYVDAQIIPWSDTNSAGMNKFALGTPNADAPTSQSGAPNPDYGKFRGYIGEVLVFTRALTDNEMFDVNLQLTAKWSI